MKLKLMIALAMMGAGLAQADVVKTSLDLSPAPWSTLVGGGVSDNGSQRTVTDTSASETKKFYRVEIVKP